MLGGVARQGNERLCRRGFAQRSVLLAFNSANTLVCFLGQNAIQVVSRLMGLILAVIGVQILIEGIRGAIVG